MKKQRFESVWDAIEDTPEEAENMKRRSAMTHPNNLRQTQLRSLLTGFLTERLASKIEKLSDDDPKRVELIAQFQTETWLEDAARRAAQIQAVTHTLKAVHPDAKGSNWRATPNALPALAVVGSHCLGESHELDVVGNAAVLDVYKFLRQEYAGESLLALAQKADPDLAAALSADPQKAQAWMQAFAGLLEPRGKPSSHTLAKQLYWPVEADVYGDAGFHLLEPLYASSLAHKVYEQVQEDRFGEAAKTAREAKKANAFYEGPVRSYPDLAIQQLGGTKPQNISQLNSERRGNNLLFASLPPEWKSKALQPLLNTESMFGRFGRRREVKATLRALLKFLKPDPAPIKPTRDTRAAHIDDLIEEFLVFTAELRELESGWSQRPECELSRQQKHWLDPIGAEQGDAQNERPLPTDVQEEISKDFANWLNQQLRGHQGDGLAVSDPEYHEWRGLVFDAIKAFEREGNHV